MSNAREWLTDAATGVIDIEASVVAMHDALLAVLDLHREQIGLDDALRYCYDCEEGWPCATVRAINKALNTGGGTDGGGDE